LIRVSLDRGEALGLCPAGRAPLNPPLNLPEDLEADAIIESLQLIILPHMKTVTIQFFET